MKITRFLMWLAIAVFCIPSIQGQSMLEAGNEWSVRDIGFFDNVVQTFLFRIQGEEVLDDVVYKVLYTTSDTTEMNWRKAALLREDSLGLSLIHI